MISIIIPICNTEQYIAQYIRMTGWRIKKILTTIYETAEKTGVDYVEMGMQRVMDRYGVVKKRDSVLLTDEYNNQNYLTNTIFLFLESTFFIR